MKLKNVKTVDVRKMYRKFERTAIAWFIVLLPAICALIFIVNKVANLGIEQERDYGAFIFLPSLLIDMWLMLVIGATLYLLEEYKS